MSKKFLIEKVAELEESPFDRQKIISWWDQEVLANSKVLVIGAGAIGNETLKNLALLGIGNIFIIDFDTVSTSNLSRTVLFRKSDTGKNKSEVAAIRTKEIALCEDVKIHWFHGDAVWELGTGIFRQMDLVLGCLDNVETRFFVNRQCWLANTPWIDAGIYELGGHVSVFIPPKLPCYQCGASKEQVKAARRRYSCDDFKRSSLEEGKMPTVQVTSSLVSAIQVQEALKLLSGQKVENGKKIYFQGKTNAFDILNLPINNTCTGHVTYPEIISLPLSSLITLRTFLEHVSHPDLSGEGATIDYRGDRVFVVSVSCKSCSEPITLNKPSFRIFDTETVCCKCKVIDMDNSVEYEKTSEKRTLSEFSLAESSDEILSMTLWEIGIPHKHIIAVRNNNFVYNYYELSSDNPFIEV